MKKIEAVHTNQDRVICVGKPGRIVFYYKPYGNNKRYYLYETEFSGSVYTFFRDKGRNLEGRGYSLTLGELYKKGKTSNPKIMKVMKYIPVQIEYVIREFINVDEELLVAVKEKYSRSTEKYDRVA